MEQEQRIARLAGIIRRRGFLPGNDIACMFCGNHKEFHGRLYDHCRYKSNAPQLYKYDSMKYTYTPAGESFPEDSIWSVNETPTYGLREDDIYVLEEIFPNKKEAISIVRYAFKEAKSDQK